MPTSALVSPVVRRHLLALVLAVPVAGPALAWGDLVKGSGQAKTERRAVTGFQAVAVAGAIDLEVRQTGQEGVAVSADDNVLPLIETVVENGRHGPTLQIRFKKGTRVQTRTPVKASVDVARLSAIAAAGAGQVQVGALKTATMNLSVAGSGDVQFESLTSDALEVRIAGSGSVRAKGAAGKATLSISGSGDIDLMPLVSDEVSIKIAGSGDAKVTANKSLTVSIAGSGDVLWTGDARDVRQSVAGSGSVKRR